MRLPLSSCSLVLFDVGGVLIELVPWEGVLGSGGGAAAGSPWRVALEELLSSEVYRRFERGGASAAEFFGEVRRLFSADLSDAEIARRYARVLGEPMEGMEELVRDLRARGLRVAGLSNTTPIHREAMFGYPAVRLLERVVTSCEVGCCKPEREAYEVALRILGAEARGTLFVDDREENVEAARALGFEAVRFEGAVALRRELGFPRTEGGSVS